MAPPKQMRNLMGILKDKISLIKATIHLSKRAATPSSYHVAVLRLTSHDPSSPPPDYLIDDVLALCSHSTAMASAYADALIARLNNTRNAHVALKCLLTLHAIISRGSSLFKDQISRGGSNFLNLSNFRDDFDPESWELSAWVRWYAGFIEQNLIVSRVLDASSADLMGEIESLAGMVEQICRAPESLHYQRLSLIYEVMKSVGEDYRIALREICVRVSEFGVRIERLNVDELKELLKNLIKVEDCREKLILMFLNKKNDGIWELIGATKEKAEEMKVKLENTRLVRFEGRRGEGSESTRFRERVDGRRSNSTQLALPAPCGNRWLDGDRKAMTLSMA